MLVFDATAARIVCAIAQILEHMLPRRELGFPDPISPLAAHVCIAFHIAIEELHHVMTPYTGVTPGTVWDNGTGVVRTPSAKRWFTSYR